MDITDEELHHLEHKKLGYASEKVASTSNTGWIFTKTQRRLSAKPQLYSRHQTSDKKVGYTVYIQERVYVQQGMNTQQSLTFFASNKVMSAKPSQLVQVAKVIKGFAFMMEARSCCDKWSTSRVHFRPFPHRARVRRGSTGPSVQRTPETP